jgi:predicted solute-binding protein
MQPEVTRRHIDLYVNEYTRNLDERAVRRLVDWGTECALYPPSSLPLFAYDDRSA